MKALGSRGDYSRLIDMVIQGVPLRGQLDLGKALFGCGAEGREEAYRLLRKARLRFRSLPPCADRAIFDWLDGQLEFTRPDNKNRHRGRQKIRNAVDEFGARRMPDEFLGGRGGLHQDPPAEPRGHPLVPARDLPHCEGAHHRARALAASPGDRERVYGPTPLIFRQLFGSGRNLGDAVLAAKRRLAAAEDPAVVDVLIGWNLLGDPTLGL